MHLIFAQARLSENILTNEIFAIYGTCMLSVLVRTFIMVDTVKSLQWILHGEMAHLSCHLDVELCEVAIETSLLLDL